MILVVFRSRLREEHAVEYSRMADEMDEIAGETPGLIAFKTFVAPDGERVTIAEFDSDESALRWRNHPRHREAQRLGRERFYSEYRVQVAETLRDYAFPDGRS